MGDRTCTVAESCCARVVQCSEEQSLLSKCSAAPIPSVVLPPYLPPVLRTIRGPSTRAANILIVFNVSRLFLNAMCPPATSDTRGAHEDAR